MNKEKPMPDTYLLLGQVEKMQREMETWPLWMQHEARVEGEYCTKEKPTMKNEMVELSVEVKVIYKKAILVFDGAKLSWLPVSQIEAPDDMVVDSTYTIKVPFWLAHKEGLI